MLSILIGHSYFLRLDRKQFERARPYPPLATLQVAALLRQAGHRVSLFDAMLADGPHEYRRHLAAAPPRVAVFYEDNFNFLTKMCLSRMRAAACDMISAARDAGCLVIVAGSDASDAPAAYLDAGAQVVLQGEGLATLSALVARIDAAPSASLHELIEGLPGIIVRLHGERDAASSTPPVLIQQQPRLPAWDLIDVQKYRDVWLAAHGRFSLNMAASRGCSFRCNWCAKPIWGNRYLQRDAAEVAAEMAYLKRTFAPDHIWFADDIFGFRPDWVLEFARAVRTAAGSVPFTIQTRADLISERMAQALREAGCEEAWIGAESGSQRILDAMNKGTSVDEILTARQRLGEQGVRVGFFIQLGYLGEELRDILETRALVDEAKPDEIGVSVSYPLPGTRFYEQVKEQLGVKTHWSESDDLAMMFQGTYRSEFYRAIRDLLHEQVERRASPHGAKTQKAEGSSLHARWNALLLSEESYRTDVASAATA